MAALAAALEWPADQSILLVDVGARWGANPPWNQLDERYVTYLGFEPDEEECGRLRDRNRSTRVEYLPVGLSDVVETQTLHLTREPGCSSAFEPNQPLLARFFLSERWDVQKTVAIKTVPLGDVLRERHQTADVLKIDVQGAALKVLRGAGDCLDEVLLVEVEVEFCEMYRGGALFGDVDQLLRRRGFDLLDLNKHYARRRILGAGHASRGQVLFADAVYVKSVDGFYGAGQSDAVTTSRLCRLLLILGLYGQFDLALEFALHEKSTLSARQRSAVRLAIERGTRFGWWRRRLFDNALCEKAGYLLSLMGNAMQMRSRLLGWGSDQAAVDGRYKYHFTHPILKLFRK